MVPDVDHAVELRVARIHLVDVQQGIPILAEFLESLVHLLGGVELSDEGVRLLLVDDLWGLEFLVLSILDVTQQEDEVLALAGLQGDLNIVGGYGAPSVGMRVARLALHDSLGIGKLVVQSYEGLAVGIVALNLRVDMIEGIVVAALAVFGLVVDGRTLNLHLAR